MRKTVLLTSFIFLMALVLVACRSKIEQSGSLQQPTSTPTQSGQIAAPDEEEVYIYNQLLSRDAIRPIYDPEFVPATEAELDDDELVLAIEIDGEAKAYPIRVLNGREIVNDELAGIPILATW